MPESSITHDTFVIERTYSAPLERVFAAFADPVKKRRWFAEGGEHHDVETFEMDFRAGGQEMARYRFKAGTPFPGIMFGSDGRYLDIVPNRRVVTASAMSLGDNCMSASLITVELLPAGSGTRLVLTHQGAFFEGADGPRMREEGWRKLLDRLANELAN